MKKFATTPIMQPILSLLLMVAILYSEKSFAQCTATPQLESVINGDFEQGFIPSGLGSFSSDQTYAFDPSNAGTAALINTILNQKATNNDSTCTSCACAWASDGFYMIDSYKGYFKCNAAGPYTAPAGTGFYRGHPFLTEMDGMFDHTKGIGGNGKFLMIDTRSGGPHSPPFGTKLWEQTVDVLANQNYYFSAWFINLTPNSTGANRAALRFLVQFFDAANNPIGIVQQLGTQFTPAEASRGNNWQQAFETVTSPVGAVRARLGIYNQSTINNGNDIGIDDISFSNGCQAVSSLSVPPAPALGDDINICATNGSITLNSNVATASGREFSWFKYKGPGQNDSIIINASTTQNTYTITRPGTYRVCVYQAPGCSKSDYITISETNTLTMTPTGSLCSPNGSTRNVTGSLAASHASYIYSWTRDASPFAGSSNTIIASQTGTYQLTATHPTRAACSRVGSSIVNSTNSMSTSLTGANLCGTGNHTFNSSLTGSAFTYRWLYNGDTVSGATSSSYLATMAGNYRVFLKHPINACNVLSPIATLSNTNPITANHQTFCAPTAKTVSLSVTGTGSFNWFANPTGGVALASNTATFTTPSISTTTSYYVQDMTSASGTALSGGANFGSADYYPGFFNGDGGTLEGVSFSTLKNNLTIVSVQVSVHEWASVSGVRVNVVDSATGTVLGSSAVLNFNNNVGSPNLFTVPLNVLISNAGNYRLVFTGSGSGPLRVQTTGYAGTDPTNSIRFNGTGPYGRNYFRNVQFSAGSNPCARLAVTAFHTGVCPAPLDWLFFNATLVEHSGKLTWATINESQIAKINVYHSKDGISFLNIGSVDARSNDGSVAYYTFSHQNLNKGFNYYRLESVDLDGSLNYSETVALKSDASGIIAYPNPFDHSTMITGLEPNSSLLVRDMMGRVIVSANCGDADEYIIEENMLPGFYMVDVFGLSQKTTIKLHKK